MGFGQRAAENGEILGEEIDDAAIDRAPAGNDAVAGNFVFLVHAEIDAAVLHEHVEFLEGIMVEQQFDAFARRQLAAAMLRVDAPLTAAHPGAFATFFEAFENMFHGT